MNFRERRIETYLIRSSARCCSRNPRPSSRNSGRTPPLNPLRATRALPASVLGPVDCFHGCQRRIAAACRALRSEVQPFIGEWFQKFALFGCRVPRPRNGGDSRAVVHLLLLRNVGLLGEHHGGIFDGRQHFQGSRALRLRPERQAHVCLKMR